MSEVQGLTVELDDGLDTVVVFNETEADGRGALFKAAKKAERDEMKEAVRAEDIANGVFTHVKDLPKREPRRAEEDSSSV